MTSMTVTAVREIPGLGARPAVKTSGCAGCGHPNALHSNGKTECKAFACRTGPSVGCTACGGTTQSPASGQACKTCNGTGSIRLSCRGFTRDQAAAA